MGRQTMGGWMNRWMDGGETGGWMNGWMEWRWMSDGQQSCTSPGLLPSFNLMPCH